MAAKTVGELIKEARTGAGLTQTGLAKAVGGLSSTDIGKAERGEKELTKEQLKAIAKATGIAQKTLLDAASSSSAAKPAAQASAKPAANKKKPAASGGLTVNTPAQTASSAKLTADEKKLLEAYRAANDETKQQVLKALGIAEEESGFDLGGIAGNLLGSLIGGGQQQNQSQQQSPNLGGALLGSLLSNAAQGQNQQSQQQGGGLVGTLLSAVGLREGEEGAQDGAQDAEIYEVKKEEQK